MTAREPAAGGAVRIALLHLHKGEIPDRDLDRFRNRAVRIWSGEHRAWWRPDYCGYTNDLQQAGLYAFEDAYDHTRHCGPEKKIIYELVEADQ